MVISIIIPMLELFTSSRRGDSGWVDHIERTLKRDTASSGFRDLAAGDAFGSSLSVSDNLLIVGAPKDGSGAGAAYIFQRIGTSWSKVYSVVDGQNNFNDLESSDNFWDGCCHWRTWFRCRDSQ